LRIFCLFFCGQFSAVSSNRLHLWPAIGLSIRGEIATSSVAIILLHPWRVLRKKAQSNAGRLVSLVDLTCHPAGPTGGSAWRAMDQRGTRFP